MANPLRLLILEDQIADAQLVLHELKRAGFAPTWDRVCTEPDFLVEVVRNGLASAQHPRSTVCP